MKRAKVSRQGPPALNITFSLGFSCNLDSTRKQRHVIPMEKTTRYRSQPRTELWTATLVLTALASAPLGAAISGRVLEEGTLLPIPGARVHLQADPSSPVVVSGVDGSYVLPVSPTGLVYVSAAVPYDKNAGTNWSTATRPALDGDTGVELRLPLVPGADAVGYEPPSVYASCEFCHVWQTGHWQNSNHSFAGGDVWVRDLYDGSGTPGGGDGYVFLDTHDAGDTGLCASCHTPLADAFDPGNVYLNQVTAQGALQGVACLACHQVDEIEGNINAFHAFGNVTYRFPEGGDLATDRYVWGPLDDVSTFFVRASHAPFIETPEFCASCHQYDPPFGQNTYDEWVASPYSDPTGEYRSCQTCHMPQADGPGLIASMGDEVVRPAEQRHEHSFIGATPETLQAAILLDAQAQQVGPRLRVTAQVTNAGAGHAFPAGVSVRNAFLVVAAEVGGEILTQVAGPTVPFWASDDVPGEQPGDYGGWPRSGFAKVNEGRINGTGPIVRPVLFVDADSLYEHSVIPAGETNTTVVEFAVPADLVPGENAQISARLIYRRAYRAVAVTKGWTDTPQGGPVEIEVAREDLEVALQPPAIVAIPVADHRALAVLALGLALAAAAFLRRSTHT